MEENKTYIQYEKEYNNIKYNEVKHQQYIDDLVTECGLPYYNLDKINALLKLTNGPNIVDSNYVTPLEAAYRCAASIYGKSSNYNMFSMHGIDKKNTLKLNLELIKFLVEQHDADCTKLRIHSYVSEETEQYLIKHGAKKYSSCIII